MTDSDGRPRRRLHLTLDMGADDLQELCAALMSLANDLLHEGREERQQVSGGWASGYALELRVTDEAMDGDTFRARLAEWSDARKAAVSRTTEGSDG